jgi:hypothetical protein
VYLGCSNNVIACRRVLSVRLDSSGRPCREGRTFRIEKEALVADIFLDISFSMHDAWLLVTVCCFP